MSVSPPDPPPPGGFSVPPGGVYYGTPTNVPPRANSGGCWKAFGITCGVLVLLAIFGSFALVNLYKREAGRKGSPVAVVMESIAAAQNGLQIQQAVVRYHQAKGKYPPSLSVLYPDYLPDGKILHSKLDSNANPGHISWTYTKPAEGAPGNTPILRLPYQITMPSGQGANRTGGGAIVINLDGSTNGNSRGRSTF